MEPAAASCWLYLHTLLYQLFMRSEGQLRIISITTGRIGFWVEVSTTLTTSHPCPLQYEFPFFIFLTLFVSSFIFPSNNPVTTVAIDIRNCMHACCHHSLFFRSFWHIDHCFEQVSLPLPTMERPGYKLFAICKMAAAETAAVNSTIQLHQIKPSHLCLS